MYYKDSNSRCLLGLRLSQKAKNLSKIGKVLKLVYVKLYDGSSPSNKGVVCKTKS